jgi:isocitrate dehydrogenase (NAD+)
VRPVTLIPGDGIGPEVVRAAVRVLAATGAELDWRPAEIGLAALEATGDPLPAATLEAIRATGCALKGPATTPIGSGFTSVNVGIRKALDLYANVRPVMSLPGVDSRYEGIDLVVVRENTEGLYSGVEHFVVPGVAVSLKIVTERACTRIGRYAFELARAQGRRRVTAVHKANIMKVTDGLFLDSVRAVAAEFPDLAYDEVIVDAMSMHLVQHPERYDVLVMDNLYGDILSDLAAGLVGGLGLAASANIGEQAAVFEAVHGSAPDIAGQGIANPTAVIRAGGLLLHHLGDHARAEALEQAVVRALGGPLRTRDLGGTASTEAFADAVIAAYRAGAGH